jgi:hypothetical protein
MTGELSIAAPVGYDHNCVPDDAVTAYKLLSLQPA